MPSLHRRRLQCYLALVLADIAMLFISFAIAGQMADGVHGMAESLFAAQVILPIFLTVALSNNAYSVSALQSTEHGMSRVLAALGAAIVVVMVLAFYARPVHGLGRLPLTLDAVIAAIMLPTGRVLMRPLVRLRCGASAINQLVIDDGGPAIQLSGAFHVNAESFGLNPSLNDPHALDRIGMVMRNADRVIVTTPPERRQLWAFILKSASVDGEVIDEAVAELSARGARMLGNQGVLQVSVGPLGMRARISKRLFDIIAAGSALVLLAPLLLAVAAAIKLEDGGPVLFVQRRVGRDNRFFRIFKFRSMRPTRAGRNGDVSASRGDNRITRIGRIIRATSIDELPQLLNVLRGDMSVVGPRPHAIGSLAGDKLFWEVDSRYWQRHALKPGLTGLAQVRGWRGATDREEDLIGRINADLEYLRGWSLWRDVWILIATVRVVAHDKAF
ncbi:MAG TPA: exopolysaccharide biosynthesis polyprenyl glycosylphosphotransferase [Novosphingobium sp.]|nr:exopolysaccharide biosynthesis polyprenyl glycosylphosphotransferase [Novosphingobium sp.]